MSVRCIEARIKQQSGDPQWTRNQIRRHNRARKYGRRHTPPRHWWELEIQNADLRCYECGASCHATETCNVSTCAKCGLKGFYCICYELEYGYTDSPQPAARRRDICLGDVADLYWLIHHEEPWVDPERFERFAALYWYGYPQDAVA